jgi:hypothetical protein
MEQNYLARGAIKRYVLEFAGQQLIVTLMQ